MGNKVDRLLRECKCQNVIDIENPEESTKKVRTNKYKKYNKIAKYKIIQKQTYFCIRDEESKNELKE